MRIDTISGLGMVIAFALGAVPTLADMHALTQNLVTQICNAGAQYQRCIDMPQPILKGLAAGP